VDPSTARGPTRGQAQGPHWRRTSHGLYVPAWVDTTFPEQRVLEQSMRLPSNGAVTGWAACLMHGAAFFDGLGRDGVTLLPVPLACGPGSSIRDGAGSLVTRDRIAGEVLMVHGVPCVVPVRAVFDAVRYAPDVREGVVAIDMMAAARRVSISMLTTYLSRRRHWRGVRQVEQALLLASERSRSPYESRMRLIWVLDAGYPTPLVNRAVFTNDGQFLGVGDLVDTEAAVFGEYDGADHRSTVQHAADLAREDRCRRANLDFFRITGPDMRDRATAVARMSNARQRGLRRDQSRDAWTLETPDWWQEEMTIDEEQEFKRWLHQPPACG